MRKNNFKQSFSNLRLPLNSNGKPVPHDNTKDTIGSIIIINKVPQLIAWRNDSAAFASEGLIKVTGDIMHPTMKKGCWIGITRLKYKQLLNYGYTYLIINRSLKAILCRVFPSRENSIKLIFDNPKYPAAVMKRSQIKAVLRVEFVIYDPLKE